MWTWAVNLFVIFAGFGLSIALAAPLLPHEFLISRVFLVIAALCIAIPGLYSIWGADQLGLWRIGVAALGGAAVAATLAAAIFFVNVRALQTLFVLVPGQESDPPLPEQCTPPSDNALMVFFGGGVSLVDTELLPQHTILRVADDDLFSIRREGKRLIVSLLRIFDERGEIIFRLENNTFPPNTDVRWVKPNRSTVMAYDRRDREVLRLVYLNQRSVRVNGIFHHASGHVITLRDDHMEIDTNRVFLGCLINSRVAISIN